MPNYNQPHQFYAGVDLHARSMFVHVLSHKGKTVFERDLPAEPDAFLDAVKPFRKNLVVGCECMFAWYWLADLCEDQRIPFVLGHALAMKYIHGGKAKSDKIDAGKLANMLRSGTAPGEETRQTQGPVGPRSQDRTYGLSPMEQTAGFRRQEVPALVR